MFRLTTLAGFLLGWVGLVQRVPPLAAGGIVLAIAAGLGVIVGIRRAGDIGTRLTAGLLFWCGGLIVALFTTGVADLGPVFLLGFPVLFAVLLFMLRSWIWSAHDQNFAATGIAPRIELSILVALPRATATGSDCWNFCRTVCSRTSV